MKFSVCLNRHVFVMSAIDAKAECLIRVEAEHTCYKQFVQQMISTFTTIFTLLIETP